jgi:hypothetical protein
MAKQCVDAIWGWSLVILKDSVCGMGDVFKLGVIPGELEVTGEGRPLGRRCWGWLAKQWPAEDEYVNP